MAFYDNIKQEVSNLREDRVYECLIESNKQLVELKQSISTDSKWIATLLSIYFLIGLGVLTEVSIGTFKISDLSVVNRYLPIGLAILINRIASKYSTRYKTGFVRDLLFRRHFELNRESVLGNHLSSSIYNYSKTNNDETKEVKKWKGCVSVILNTPLLIVFFSGVALIAYTYYVVVKSTINWHQENTPNALDWLVTILTISFLLVSVKYLWNLVTESMELMGNDN